MMMKKINSSLSRPIVFIWCCICAYVLWIEQTHVFWCCVCPTLWIGFNTSPQFMGQMVTNTIKTRNSSQPMTWANMHPRGPILFHLGDREGDCGILGSWCSQNVFHMTLTKCPVVIYYVLSLFLTFPICSQ
jgi:hypothetical protein